MLFLVYVCIAVTAAAAVYVATDPRFSPCPRVYNSRGRLRWALIIGALWPIFAAAALQWYIRGGFFIERLLNLADHTVVYYAETPYDYITANWKTRVYAGAHTRAQN